MCFWCVCLSPSFSTLIYETQSLTEPRRHRLIGWYLRSRDLPVSAWPNARVMIRYHHAWPLCGCWESKHRLMWQVLCQQHCLLSFSCPSFPTDTCFINVSNSPKLGKFDSMALAPSFPYPPGSEPSAMKMKMGGEGAFVFKWRSPKASLIMILLLDYIWRRCPWLRQGTEKQIPNQKVFCEASPNGLPASADCVRGGQHGNVSSGRQADFHLICVSELLPTKYPPSLPDANSLSSLSLSGLTLAEAKANKLLFNLHFPLTATFSKSQRKEKKINNNTEVQIAF